MNAANLIEAASKRLLTKTERIALARHFMLKKHGTVAAARKAVNRAYALAKQYDRNGGADTYDALMGAFDEVGAGTEEFGILYDATK